MGIKSLILLQNLASLIGSALFCYEGRLQKVVGRLGLIVSVVVDRAIMTGGIAFLAGSHDVAGYSLATVSAANQVVSCAHIGMVPRLWQLTAAMVDHFFPAPIAQTILAFEGTISKFCQRRILFLATLHEILLLQKSSQAIRAASNVVNSPSSWSSPSNGLVPAILTLTMNG
jgi:hypothetical protein